MLTSDSEAKASPLSSSRGGVHYTSVVPSIAVAQLAIDPNLKHSGPIPIMPLTEICAHDANLCSVGKVPVGCCDVGVVAGSAMNFKTIVVSLTYHFV